MAVNYAEKFSQTIDEQLSKDSLTDKAVNKDYDFDGVNKVNVYSVETVPLNDYDINAKSNRYGTPVELGNVGKRNASPISRRMNRSAS